MKRNYFLWQLIIYSAKVLLSVTRTYFLHVVCDRKNSFIGQEIQKYLEVKFVPKQRELLPKFRVSLKILWESGSLAPREYPTLVQKDIRIVRRNRRKFQYPFNKVLHPTRYNPSILTF